MEERIGIDIREKLNELAEPSVKSFNESLMPGTEVIGIRIPKLRSFAKELSKRYECQSLLEAIPKERMEERLLYGLIIGYSKLDFDRRIQFIEGFIPLINSWGVCDCACSTFSSLKKNLEETFHFIEPYIYSKKEYEIRFGVVMLMEFFINDEYIDKTLDILRSLCPEQYYAKMAVAWAISVCFVKYRDKTMSILQDNMLDKDTYNKSLQKIVESRRVSVSDKVLIKEMRR